MSVKQCEMGVASSTHGRYEKYIHSFRGKNLKGGDRMEDGVAGVEMFALMMEAASTSETSVNFYRTTRRNNPEDSHLQRKMKITYVHICDKCCNGNKFSPIIYFFYFSFVPVLFVNISLHQEFLSGSVISEWVRILVLATAFRLSLSIFRS
jgi:hypothetical protein